MSLRRRNPPIFILPGPTETRLYSYLTISRSKRFDISDLERKDIVLSTAVWSENKGAEQLYRYCKADLCLCFRIFKMLAFS